MRPKQCQSKPWNERARFHGMFLAFGGSLVRPSQRHRKPCFSKQFLKQFLRDFLPQNRADFSDNPSAKPLW